YLFALASFRDPALLDRALQYALAPEIRSQDEALYLGSFFGNDAALDRAWAFVKAHWSEIEPKVTIAGSDVNLAASLSAFCSAPARDDIRTFFAAHPLPAAGRTLQQPLERTPNCTAMRDQQQPNLDRCLAKPGVH